MTWTGKREIRAKQTVANNLLSSVRQIQSGKHLYTLIISWNEVTSVWSEVTFVWSEVTTIMERTDFCWGRNGHGVN